MPEVNVSATVGEMSATVGEMSATVGEMSSTVREMSGTVGEMSATVGEMSATVRGNVCNSGEIEHGLGNLRVEIVIHNFHKLPFRIHGLTCEKPIRI